MQKPIHCNFKIERFEAYFDFYRENRLGLEISLSGPTLDNWESNGTLEKLQKIKDAWNPSMSLHSPFFDFKPDSVDSAIRNLWFERTLECFRLAEFINAKTIVFHSTYNDLQMRTARRPWVERTLEFWREALPQLPECSKIVLENIYERTPELLAEVIAELNHPRVGHCFDFGHYAAWGNGCSLKDWFAYFPGKVFELHLHDNHGDEDSHMAIGEGSLNFKGLIDAIAPFRDEVIYTIEGTPRNDAISYEYIRKNFP